MQFAPLNNAGQVILITLLLFAVAAPALADSARVRFTDYINQPFYEKKLFNAAAAEAMKDNACGTPGTRVVRKSMDVTSKVAFVKKRLHPVKGIWRERTHVLICGKSVDVNVTVVARPNYAPAFLAKQR